MGPGSIVSWSRPHRYQRRPDLARSLSKLRFCGIGITAVGWAYISNKVDIEVQGSGLILGPLHCRVRLQWVNLIPLVHMQVLIGSGAIPGNQALPSHPAWGGLRYLQRSAPTSPYTQFRRGEHSITGRRSVRTGRRLLSHAPLSGRQ